MTQIRFTGTAAIRSISAPLFPPDPPLLERHEDVRSDVGCNGPLLLSCCGVNAATMGVVDPHTGAPVVHDTVTRAARRRRGVVSSLPRPEVLGVRHGGARADWTLGSIPFTARQSGA